MQAALKRGRVNKAVWVRVLVVCLLRVAAPLRLFWTDVVLPGDARFVNTPNAALLLIARYERASRAGSVNVPGPLEIEILRLLLRTQPPGNWRLFRAGDQTPRFQVATLTADLG